MLRARDRCLASSQVIWIGDFFQMPPGPGKKELLDRLATTEDANIISTSRSSAGTNTATVECDNQACCAAALELVFNNRIVFGCYYDETRGYTTIRKELRALNRTLLASYRHWQARDVLEDVKWRVMRRMFPLYQWKNYAEEVLMEAAERGCLPQWV